MIIYAYIASKGSSLYSTKFESFDYYSFFSLTVSILVSVLMQSVMGDCESITAFLPSNFKPRKNFAPCDFPVGLKQCCTRNNNLTTSKTDDAFGSDNQSEEQVAAPRKLFAVRDFPEGLKHCFRDINLISKKDDAYESDDPSEEPDELVIDSDFDDESDRTEPAITCEQEVADLVTVSVMPGNSEDQSTDRSLTRARNQEQDNGEEDASYDDLEVGTALRRRRKVVAESDKPEEVYEVPYGIVCRYGILTLYPAYYKAATESLYSGEDDANESEDEDELYQTDLDISENSDTEEVDD